MFVNKAIQQEWQAARQQHLGEVLNGSLQVALPHSKVARDALLRGPQHSIVNLHLATAGVLQRLRNKHLGGSAAEQQYGQPVVLLQQQTGSGGGLAAGQSAALWLPAGTCAMRAGVETCASRSPTVVSDGMIKMLGPLPQLPAAK